MDRHEPPPKPDPRTWTTAEASRRLEEVLRLAREEGPQVIVMEDGVAVTLRSNGDRPYIPARPGSLRDILVNSPFRDMAFDADGAGMPAAARDPDL